MKTKLITALLCVIIGSVGMLTIVVLQNEEINNKNKYLTELVKDYKWEIEELTKCEGD